jgi:PPOX class F420-dependent enzyme/OxyR family protein
MKRFTERELDYLLSERRLGRLATIQPDGQPHVVPVGWSYDPATETIVVSGRNFGATRKFRNAKLNPKVSLVVDDVLPPWRPRCVLIQGEADAVDAAASPTGQAFLRIRPTNIISFGHLDE